MTATAQLFRSTRITRLNPLSRTLCSTRLNSNYARSYSSTGMNTQGTAPDTMRALEALEPDLTVTDMKITDSRPVAHPILQDGDASRTITVKIVSAALNPIDYKMLAGPASLMVKTWPHVTGCDMAGTVAEIEEGCMRKVGERVWAYTDLGKPSSGTLAEYCLVPEDMLGTVPDGMSFDEASTIGVGSLTAAIGLWKHLGLQSEPGSAPSGEAVLVYGASSSVGCYAVQLAAIAGYRVVAVASKRNHGLVTELGAAQAVDYNDPDWVDQIARESQNKHFVGAFDAIGGEPLVQCFEAMSKAGAPKARATTTTPVKELLGAALKEKLNDINCINLGTAYFDAQRPFVASYVQTTSALLAAGKLKPNRVKVLGGLSAAIQGYQDMQAGKVSGEKLVVHPSE